MERIKRVVLVPFYHLINKIKIILFGHYFTDKNKLDVLIFGASQGGINVYKSIKKKYNVVSFIDNNSQLHGTFLLSKKIYPASEIKNLSYDKLIIASDYYKEIFAQLTDDLGIAIDLISVFNSADKSNTPWFMKLDDLINQYIDDYLCSDSSFKSRYIFALLSKISNRFNSVELRNITWLDKLDSHKVKIFRGRAEGQSFAPHFINQNQEIKSVILPDVSLYHFKNGRIMTAVNGVVFNQSEIALARVPSFPLNDAQYCAAFVTAHGSANALVRKYSSTHIKRGIAIIGSNDTNYYHWVIEVLSKFQFIAELPEEYAHFPILISEQALNIESIQSYINNFNISRPIIYLKSSVDYKVKDLLFISPTNYLVANVRPGRQSSAESCFVREESLQYLRNSIINSLDNESEIITPQKVFLARKGIIRNYNQTEVFDLLYKYGFEAIYLEDLNLLQQVRLMRQAEVIIGPTGAAWTNLIFCNIGTRALCWMPEEAGDLACFSNLAQFSGVNMDYLHYSAGEQDSRNLYYTNYYIAINVIKHWLDNIA